MVDKKGYCTILMWHHSLESYVKLMCLEIPFLKVDYVLVVQSELRRSTDRGRDSVSGQRGLYDLKCGCSFE